MITNNFLPLCISIIRDFHYVSKVIFLTYCY